MYSDTFLVKQFRCTRCENTENLNYSKLIDSTSKMKMNELR